MKKNLELVHYKNDNKLMISKKNYITMILPIIFFLIIIIVIAYLVFFGNSSGNKLKSYLEQIGYTCNNEICTIEKDNKIYTYNLNNLKLIIDDMNYNITISENTPILEVKNKQTICTYTKPNYTIFTLVDDTYLYDNNCEDYIDIINNYIEEYKEVLTAAKVDVNKNEK